VVPQFVFDNRSYFGVDDLSQYVSWGHVPSLRALAHHLGFQLAFKRLKDAVPPEATSSSRRATRIRALIKEHGSGDIRCVVRAGR